MDILLLCAGIYLVFKYRTLQIRVKELERIVQGLVRDPQGDAVAAQDVSDPTAGPLVEPIAAAASLPIDATPPEPAPAALSDAPTVPDPQSQPVVFRADLAKRLLRFLRENWVYVVSAASMALAGVFLVQYGIESGLIPPALRVLAAVALGTALIGAGEYLRRRFGDAPDGSVAYLPAIFSGAGIVSIFAAVVAARQLYGLIGPEVAMVGYVLTAAVAVVLGWFNGALLVAVGLLGASAAPFLVGGGTDAAPWLYLYYALICAMGLGVDTVRRWAWVSVLALILAFAGAWLMRLNGAGVEGWIMVLIVLPLLAAAVPDRSLFPRHAGPALLPSLRARRLPFFPVRLAAGSLIAACVFLAAEFSGPAGVSLFVLVGLALLALLFLIWASEAEGLADLALVPVLVFLALLAYAALDGLPLYATYWQQSIAARPPETSAPMLVSQMVAMAVAITLAAFWRALRPSPLALWHAVAAVLTAPLAVVICDLLWHPAGVIGAFPWALHPLGLAALMVGFAQVFARRDGADHRRTAHAALSAMSLIALALFTLSSATPLTLALAALILVAAGLDRRFGLPEMGLFIQIGAAVLTSRLMLDPGLFWAIEGPLGAVVLAFAAPIAAAVAAIWLYRDLSRPVTRGVLESAAMFWTLMLADVLIGRWVSDGMGFSLGSHWGASLLAMPWLGMAIAQAYRAQFGGLARLRRWLAAGAAVLAVLLLALAVLALNPLSSMWPDDLDSLVRGPLLADSLAVAYLAPGLILLAAALRLPVFARFVRVSMLVLGSALSLLYVGLEIRRFWQGDWLGRPELAQGELYSYTLALMILGAGLLYAAIMRRSQGLRKLAMAVIAVTVAKVFLLDAAGLTGLMRVASFLGLGLSLAGLALLNRWAMQVARQGRD